jgi:hypothetical protein
MIIESLVWRKPATVDLSHLNICDSISNSKSQFIFGEDLFYIKI